MAKAASKNAKIKDLKASAEAKNWTKVIKAVRSPKTGAYTFKVIQRSSSAKKKRFFCKLGRKRRFVLMLECDTLFPVIGFFPVI